MYTPLLVLLLIVASFYVGRLSAQVSSLKNGTQAVAGATAPTAVPEATKIDVPQLKDMAKALGLDTNKFNSCLDSGSQANRVAAEQKEGGSLGVSGTPSFLINGILVVGALPQSNFEQIIDAELKNGTGDKVAETVTGEKADRKKISLADGYVTGPNNAKVKIVEFTDFQCPFCVRAYPTIQGLLKKYGNQISLEYKSFPLSFHPYAQKAAEAALCAGDQGKFWEMHDKIFADQQ